MASDGDDEKKKTTTSVGGDETKKKKKEKSTDDADPEPKPPSHPPVEAATRRLERLLGGTTAVAKAPAAVDGGGGGGGATTTSAPSPSSVAAVDAALLHASANPAKIVRRWLGTSSGAASKATLESVKSASIALLDPNGSCAAGRELLSNLASGGDGGGGAVAMEVETTEGEEEKKDDGGGGAKTPGPYLSAASREVESWLISLAVRILRKNGDHPASYDLATRGVDVLSSHLKAASVVAARSGAAASLAAGGGSSSLYPLLARMHRYRSLAAESLGAPEVRAEMREGMAKAHREACLRRDVDTQSTLLNLMLRDLLSASQVEQAQKLLSNSTFPDAASNNQLCRYLYHSGLVQALRLEYTSSFSNLSQCLRKAPTNAGLGFRIAVQRLLVVVQLLMGEIPDRNVFLSTGMKGELAPYMKIAQAVRRGDLAVFRDTVAQFASRLKEDGTYTLISRLAHSVVKAGLRRLNVSYSRISLEDVAKRLGLPNATSAEFVVAKAVRDGVVDATIDREGRYVRSHDLVDVYATTEPAEAFHRRIAYCLSTHNDAVRGMRYPPDAYKRQLEASRGQKGKDDGDDKTDEEKAQELEEEMDEEY